MGRYKKLLVAFDGSDSCKNALDQAISLAATEHSWIKVIAVVPPYEGDLELVGVSNITEAIEGPGERLLAEARAIAGSRGVSVLTNLEQGEPYERIVEVAETEGCDLVIMGRKGRHQIERSLMGSVTARVIGHTYKDVLVIPKESGVKWGKVLLATDGSRFSETATEHALDIAATHNASLEAVTVLDINDEFYAQAPERVAEMTRLARSLMDGISGKARAAGVPCETFVMEGEPYKAIIGRSEEGGSDVIIMGSHGRKGISRLLMGSVTEKVIGYSDRPVLVTRSR
jgi:nucleotide-binding universal stress UspA family protein